jgi:hypothetical protein
MDDRLYLTLPQNCPGCGAKNDGHYATSELTGPPEPGSVSVCAYCQTIGIYSEGGIRLPTFEERRIIASDATVQQAVETVKAWLKLRHAWGN